jgi:hypothetical protein
MSQENSNEKISPESSHAEENSSIKQQIIRKTWNECSFLETIGHQNIKVK